MNEVSDIVNAVWGPAVEISILAVAIYYVLRFVHGTRGFSILIGFLVVLLTIFSSVAWLAAAVVALISERVPRVLADVMLAALRVRLRFIAYHLSLVDRYPVFDDHGAHQPSPAAC